MADEFAYKRDSKLQERLSREIEVIVKQPGNTVCADCDETKRIRFCSVTLGVFLCNRCYGQHRQLGAHVTRGKCLGLDAWKPEEIELLRAIGNTKANARYEANLPPPPWKRPTTASTEREVLAFIKDKYERQKFAAVPCSGPVAAMPAAAASAARPPPAAPLPPAPSPAADLLGGWASFDEPKGSSSSAATQPVVAAAAPFDLLFMPDSSATSTRPTMLPPMPAPLPVPTASSWGVPSAVSACRGGFTVPSAPSGGFGCGGPAMGAIGGNGGGILGGMGGGMGGMGGMGGVGGVGGVGGMGSSIGGGMGGGMGGSMGAMGGMGGLGGMGGGMGGGMDSLGCSMGGGIGGIIPIMNPMNPRGMFSAPPPARAKPDPFASLGWENASERSEVPSRV